MEIGSVMELNINELFKDGQNEIYFPFMKNKDYNFFKFFNTGRSSIEYLFRILASNREVKEVLVPNFICDSVTDAITRAGFKCRYFKIDNDLTINIEDLQSKMKNNNIIFICHYFGTYLTNKEINFLKDVQKDGNVIIEDLSHALFTTHKRNIGFGNYIVASIRKWLSVPDGAVLASKTRIPSYKISNAENTYTQNYLITQLMKFEYLNNHSIPKSKENKDIFLNFNKIAMDSLFSDYTIRKMSKVTEKYLSNFEPHSLIKKRKKNYDYLFENLKEHPKIDIVVSRKSGEVPYNFTIYSNERDKLRDYLQKNNIYCNIHWALSKEKLETASNLEKISKNILTIPCDQRYGEKEMNYIVKVINDYFKK